MATLYAQIGGGNWDAAGQWNTAADGSGSFATPGNGDTCDLNGKTVVANLTTIPAGGGSLALLRCPGKAGRLHYTLTGSTAFVLNCDIITPGNVLSTAFIEVTGAAPSSSLTINGDYVGTGGGTSAGIYGNTTGTITINGDVTSGTTVGAWKDTGGLLAINGNVLAASATGVLIQSGASLALVGNLTGGTQAGLTFSGAGSGTITGNVVSGSSNGYGISLASGTLAVTGNITPGSVPGVYVTAGALTVNGSIVGGGGSARYGVWIDGSGTLTVNGSITGGSHRSAYGVLNIVSGSLTVNGSLVHTTSTCAVAGPCLLNSAAGRYTQHVQTGGGTFKQYREDVDLAVTDVRSGTTYWHYGASDTGTMQPAPADGDIRLGVGTGTLVVPAAADVQSGVQYGAAGTEYTGTFAAPAQSDVRQGVGYGAASTEYTGSLGGGVVTLTAA